MNFYLGLSATSVKTFELVSANLKGPCLRHIQKVAAKRRSPPFINLDFDAMKSAIASHFTKIRSKAGNNNMRISFSCGVDATALVQVYQISTTHGAIVGGAYPNHFISLEDKTKNETVKLLKECQEGLHGKLASEIKVAVLCFQNTPPDMSPYFVLVGRPQTTNESNTFGLTGELLGYSVFCILLRLKAYYLSVQ